MQRFTFLTKKLPKVRSFLHSAIHAGTGAPVNLLSFALTLARARAVVIVPERSLAWPPRNCSTPRRRGAKAEKRKSEVLISRRQQLVVPAITFRRRIVQSHLYGLQHDWVHLIHFVASILVVNRRRHLFVPTQEVVLKILGPAGLAVKRNVLIREIKLVYQDSYSHLVDLSGQLLTFPLLKQDFRRCKGSANRPRGFVRRSYELSHRYGPAANFATMPSRSGAHARE